MDLGIGGNENGSDIPKLKQKQNFKPTNMISVLMILLGFVSFWLLFRVVDVFDKI